MGGDNAQSVQAALRRVAVRLAPERAYIAASDVGIALRPLPGSGAPESIWFAVVSEAGKINKLGELASWLQGRTTATMRTSRESWRPSRAEVRSKGLSPRATRRRHPRAWRRG